MPDRKDALCAAAELILAIENTAARAERPIRLPPSAFAMFSWRGEQYS